MIYGEDVNRQTNTLGLTIERVNNDIPHVIDNCLLACMSCNHARAASYMHDEFKQYYADIKLKLVKKCQGTCGEIKSTVDFHRHGTYKDRVRYTPKCKVCRNMHQKTQRERRARPY
jgi:hypothetical protein